MVYLLLFCIEFDICSLILAVSWLVAFSQLLRISPSRTRRASGTCLSTPQSLLDIHGISALVQNPASGTPKSQSAQALAAIMAHL